MKALRIGLFGGSFNPFHKGHLYCLKKAKKNFNLSWIEVILAYQSPLKSSVRGKLLLEERIEMLKIALEPYKKNFRMNLLEVERKGTSYTIDTLSFIREKYNKECKFYLIIGLDQWKKFHLWKSYAEILKKAHLVVFCREMDFYFKDFKSFSNVDSLFKKLISLQGNFVLNHVQSFRKNQRRNQMTVHLKSGQKIYFLLNERGNRSIELCSSTLIRDKIQRGEDVSKWISPKIRDYIFKKKLYLSRKKI